MYAWSEEHQMIRTAMKDFIAKEIIPIRDDLEHGDLPPYEVLRKLYTQFGIAEQAEASFWKRLEFDKQVAAGEVDPSDRPSRHSGGDAGFSLIPTIELCRQCPGLVTALGVSTGLTASAINGKGTI
ncbi:MAG: acyl-CoA dehydrogenase, partial [Ilumatobacter fluminis]